MAGQRRRDPSVDLAAFGARLLRFDPGALIRLREGRAWGRLPWDVLVSVSHASTGDRVVAAASGESRDADWRGALPPGSGRVVETIPASVIWDAARAAAATWREINSRPQTVGERAIRDALLDHAVITGTSDADGTEFVVPQRLVQAIVRVGLLRSDDAADVDVLIAGVWTGLRTASGEAWYRKPSGLSIRPLN